MKIFKYTIAILAVTLFSGCKKDFLSRFPKADPTDEFFFHTVEDLKTYTNGFYLMMNAPYSDVFSDNIGGFTGSHVMDNMVRGTVSSQNVSGSIWSGYWPNIRKINFMMDRLEGIEGDPGEIKHYEGIARFFRAYLYYELVKNFHNVPWYDTVLEAESEELYKPADPRTVVVGRIMEDLEFAVANIKTSSSKELVSKHAALTLLARICLHEGTFRKYHEELELQSTAIPFLERAVSASAEVMTASYAIHTDQGDPALNYRVLFCSNNLSGNSEMIFIQKNSRELGVANNTHTVLDWQWALNGSLMDEYLMDDGTPFTDQSNYIQTAYTDLFENRDPRLSETIMPPGFTVEPDNPAVAPYRTRPNFGGYLQLKFYPRTPDLRGGWEINYTDLPIMRLAEVLLIQAEAKAELGTLTQTDLDNTINKLRARVNMPDLSLTTANANVDAALAAKYPNVTGANKGVILEIRRGRRVELACEGFRLDDIIRWKAGELLAEPAYGFYVTQLGAIDVSGDGVEDIAILENPQATGPIAGLPPQVREGLSLYYISDRSFYLSNTNSGYILFDKDRQSPREFVSPKYYYKPIPVEETVLNTNLKQVFGW